MKFNKKTAPGSKPALEAGCTCACMDNHYGAGRGGDGKKYGWYITEGCPVHAPVKNDL